MGTMQNLTGPHLLRTLLALCLAFTVFLAAAAPAGKGFGFGLEVSVEGFFAPKVTKVVVKSLEAGSQAQSAGLAVGDELIRVDGLTVPGAPASELKSRMEFEVGKPKKLGLRRTDGKEYEATFTKG